MKEYERFLSYSGVEFLKPEEKKIYKFAKAKEAEEARRKQLSARSGAKEALGTWIADLNLAKTSGMTDMNSTRPEFPAGHIELKEQTAELHSMLEPLTAERV